MIPLRQQKPSTGISREWTKSTYLNRKVGNTRINLHTCRQPNGPQRTVRCNRYIIRLCHGCNPLHLRDAPNVTDVRLQNIHTSPFQEWLHIPPTVQPLSQRNRQVARPRQCFNPLDVLGEKRLFDEHGTVRLEEGGKLFSHRTVDAAMEIDASIETCCSDGLHALDAGIQGGRRVEPADVLGAVHLDGGETLCFASETVTE